MEYNFSREEALQALKRVISIFRSHAEAEAAEIAEQVAMTPAQRLQIARVLKKKVYGSKPPDVRKSHARSR